MTKARGSRGRYVLNVSDRVLLLHLSDLHLGAGELVAEDTKVTIPEAKRRAIVERLGDYLRALPNTPDFVCVTGDIANRGDPDGFARFLSWVTPLIEEGTLPPANRFLVTPGNHDVKQGLSSEAERFAGFYEIGRAFPHAFVPGLDPALGTPVFEIGDGAAGGLKTLENFGKVEVVRSDPYLYDQKARLLIFAFNSSLACGVYPTEGESLLREVDRALEMAQPDSSLSRQLAAVRKQAAADLMLDAGLIGDDQLRYFKRLMTVIRDALGAEWRRTTKIAMLHHHVNPIWDQQLELKPFESIIDAAQAKQALTEFGFDVVLHGHKHKNGVALDGTVIPTTEGRGADPIGIVSGGTACGVPAPNDRQTFKVVIIDPARRRDSAVVEEYPLGETADPEATMRKDRRVYRLPLADRVPELHDDPSLKALLDKKLLDENVPHDPAPDVRTDGGDVALRGDTDLVAERARYRFASVIEDDGARIFIDVFLATGRLDFRQRARIHWMLVDVKHFGAATKAPVRIQLIIGNLADTHFSRERSPKEIEASIEELRRSFAPALASGLLEIFEKKLTQEEVDELDQTIPAAKRGSE
jgi:3',5'-cyclic AMP phosphodiesterase CpdA